ncbi:nucleosome assembly protein 1,4 [Tanacetum coccineum]
MEFADDGVFGLDEEEELATAHGYSSQLLLQLSSTEYSSLLYLLTGGIDTHRGLESTSDPWCVYVSHADLELLAYASSRCPNLEVLLTYDVCGDAGFQIISQYCKKLRKLNHLGQATHMGLIALAQGCPNLENLDVTLLDISNEAMEYVGTYLKNLRKFRMNLVNKSCITDLPLDNGIRAMLIGCKKLERLHVSLCHGGLTDVGLGYIGKYGHNLRSLSLEYTGESDAGLVELSIGCPKLRKLRIMECPFSEQAVEFFLFNIHTLRYINFCFGDCGLALTRPTVPADAEPKLITPNIIRSVSSILDDDNVIINSMSFSRIARRKQTVMVIEVDDKPSKYALKKIDEIPSVEEFVYLALW